MDKECCQCQRLSPSLYNKRKTTNERQSIVQSLSRMQLVRLRIDHDERQNHTPMMMTMTTIAVTTHNDCKSLSVSFSQ